MFLRPVEQKTRKYISLLAKKINCDYGEQGVLVHDGCMCELELFDVPFLLHSCLVKTVNGQLQETWSNRERQVRTQNIQAGRLI